MRNIHLSTRFHFYQTCSSCVIQFTVDQSLSCLLYAQYTTFISHPLTHFSVVVLRLCVEQPADPLHTPELDLHVSQVTHHPVQVVRHLEYQIQSFRIGRLCESLILFSVCDE